MTLNKRILLLLILSFSCVFKNVCFFGFWDDQRKMEQRLLDYCNDGDLKKVEVMILSNQVSSFDSDYKKQGEAIKRALDSGNTDLYNFLKSKYPHFSRKGFYEAVAQCRERVARGEEDNCNRVEEYYKAVTKNELPPQGVDLYISENDAKAFLYAVKSNNLEAIESMIQQGFSVNSFFNGATPLHYALYHKANEIARLLVQHGADVRIRTMHGDTPLHIAAKKCNPEMITFLRQNGASVEQVNYNNDTPLQSLKTFGKAKESEFLKAFSTLTENIQEDSHFRDNFIFVPFIG